MKAREFPPIRYDRRQVAALFRFVRFLDPGCRPSLEAFELSPDGKGGFTWIPR